MSDLQRDIEWIDLHFRLYKWDSEALSAWQRIRARLTPDRERVAEAIYVHACIPGDFMWELLDEKAKDHWRAYADAAIAAMGEP